MGHTSGGLGGNGSLSVDNSKAVTGLLHHRDEEHADVRQEEENENRVAPAEPLCSAGALAPCGTPRRPAAEEEGAPGVVAGAGPRGRGVGGW